MIALLVIAAVVVLLIGWARVLQRRLGARGRIRRGGLLVGAVTLMLGCGVAAAPDAFASKPVRVPAPIGNSNTFPAGFACLFTLQADLVGGNRVFSPSTAASSTRPAATSTGSRMSIPGPRPRSTNRAASKACPPWTADRSFGVAESTDSCSSPATPAPETARLAAPTSSPATSWPPQIRLAPSPSSRRPARPRTSAHSSCKPHLDCDALRAGGPPQPRSPTHAHARTSA